MGKLILIISIFVYTASFCQVPQQNELYHGSIPAAQYAHVDSLIIELITDTVYFADPCDSLRLIIKDLHFRLNRIKYYSKIVDHKPSQVKFLNTWIKRALK